MTSFAAVAVLTAVLGQQTDSETQHPQLKEWGGIMVGGTWVREFAAREDGGEVKAGDKLVWHHAK